MRPALDYPRLKKCVLKKYRRMTGTVGWGLTVAAVAAAVRCAGLGKAVLGLRTGVFRTVVWDWARSRFCSPNPLQGFGFNNYHH